MTNFADIFTFNRASTATHKDPISGLLNDHGIDQPRLGENGLLMERSATNNFTYSEFQNSTITGAFNCSLSTMQFRSGLVSNAVRFDSQNLEKEFYLPFVGTNGTKYCLSFFVQMEDGLPPYLGGSNVADSNRSFSPMLAGDGVPDPITIEQYTSNIWRVSQEWTCNSSINKWGVIKYTSNNSRPCRFSGFQVELTSLTSYIPTEASAVTRSGESNTRDTLTGEYNSAEGTFFIEMILGRDMFKTSTNIGENGSKRIVAWNPTSQRFNCQNGSGTTVEYSKAVNIGDRVKLAISISPNNQIITSIDGINNTGALTGNQLSELSGFRLPAYGSGEFLNFKYWPYAFSATDLQELTA